MNKQDPILKLRNDKLKPFVLKLTDKAVSVSSNILKSRRESWFRSLFEAGIPISYFIVNHTKSFQY